MNTLSQRLAAQADPKEIISELIAQNNLEILQETLKNLLNNDQKILYAKRFFATLITYYNKLSNDEVLNFCSKIIINTNRKSAFEEEFFQTREILADVYVAKSDLGSAVKILKEIKYNELPFLNPEKKLEKYLQISKLYFALDDPGYASPWIEQALPLKDECENQQLLLEFELIFAKHLDFSRKFLQAATFYYKCANKMQGFPGVELSDILEVLSCAVVSAILGAAGPQRSRILAQLYKDERLRGIEIFDILEKMFLNRIIREREVVSFEKKLQSYHKSTTSEGLNILSRAIVEHNIVAVSQIYSSVYFDKLALILQIDINLLEKLLQSMIIENRLKARIDQISGVIEFTRKESVIEDWNNQIQNFCSKLDNFLEKAGRKCQK